MRRRLLTIGHSYVVSLNRRLARELALAGRDVWDITCVSPKYFHGGKDLAPVRYTRTPEDNFPVVALDAYLTSQVHVFSWSPQLLYLLGKNWHVVHAWEEPYVLAGWEIARATRRNSKLIFFSAQSNPKTYPPPFSWFERGCMARAAGWISCGNTIEYNLQSRPGYSIPHRMIPLGVDMETFRPSARLRNRALEVLSWSASGPPVVGFVGRFTQAKGLRLLLRALRAVQEPFRALFVGAGELEYEVREFCQELGDKARMLHVKHDEVATYMNAIDLLCAPSQTTPQWREQFGRMLIEAGACGVPVIGSDSGEIPFVIGDSGVTVGESDLNGWVAAISDLLASPRRRADLGARGQARASDVYSWPVIARQYLTFFDELYSRT